MSRKVIGDDLTVYICFPVCGGVNNALRDSSLVDFQMKKCTKKAKK